MKKDSKEKHPQYGKPSQLFLVRLWVGEKETGEAAIEWYGKVQQTVTGERYYFHSSSELIETLLHMMQGMTKVVPSSQPGGSSAELSGCGGTARGS